VAGWSFWSNTVWGCADGVNYGYIYGTADGATVWMADAIIAMTVLSGMTSTIHSDYAASGADVDNDGRVGLAAVIFILQTVAGMR
jgi:hypothetical protein